MWKRDFFLLFLFALLFLAPILWLVRNLDLRLDTDYDAHLPVYEFLVNEIRASHRIPHINPYITTGLPTFGDPISELFNPLFMVPLILYGVEYGIRVVFLIMIVLSGCAMWFLLTEFGVRGQLRMWGAMLYEVSGSISARIAAGHVEKFFSFVFIPLIFLAVLQKNISLKKMFIASGAIAGLFYSGDFYSIWMIVIFFISIRFFWLIRKATSLSHEVRYFTSLTIIGVLFLLPKLIPFLLLRNSIVRFFPIYPTNGSIHFFFAPLVYIVPFGVSFYDRHFFQDSIGFYYNWFEYFNFISPIPFIFLFSVGRIKREIAGLFIFIVFIGGLYLSVKFPYSPFYWLLKLIPTLGVFRVPQRILLVLTPIIILLLSLCAVSLERIWSKRKILFVLISSVFWTMVVSQRIIYSSFEPREKAQEFIAKELRRWDSSNFYVASFASRQLFLMQQHIASINYYYAWKPKDAPNFISPKSGSDFSPLSSVRPKYIIAPLTLNFFEYSYRPFFETSVARVWKTDDPTITPHIFP